MAFARAIPVEADPPLGPDRQRQQAGPGRDLGLQQHVEAPAAQRTAHGPTAAAAGLLVQHDEFDPVQTLDQPVLAAADDPGDRCVRKRALQRPDQRDAVTHVAERRQPHQRDRARGCVQWTARRAAGTMRVIMERILRSGPESVLYDPERLAEPLAGLAARRNLGGNLGADRRRRRALRRPRRGAGRRRAVRRRGPEIVSPRRAGPAGRPAALCVDGPRPRAQHPGMARAPVAARRRPAGAGTAGGVRAAHRPDLRGRAADSADRRCGPVERGGVRIRCRALARGSMG